MTATSNNLIKATPLGAERRILESKIKFLDKNKFIELNDKINSSYKDIQDKYGKLKKVASPVVKNEYLCGLIKSTDVEKSLEGLLDTIKGLAECTLGAFQANGKNLSAILELMKISVSIESGLYKLLDDSECSKENIANLLHDFCAQYNIDSSAIEGLFEQSFNRTLTLRARINDLREELLERISKYEDRFEHLDETIQQKEGEFTYKFETKINDLREKLLERISKYEDRFEHLDETIQQKEGEFTYKFETKAEEYKEQLEARVSGYLKVVNSYNDELGIVRSSYKQEIELEKKFLMDSIEQYNIELSKRHDVKFEQYERENAELKTYIKLLNESVSKLQNRLTWSFIISAIIVLTVVVNFIV